jgi:hypothetical protein
LNGIDIVSAISGRQEQKSQQKILASPLTAWAKRLGHQMIHLQEKIGFSGFQVFSIECRENPLEKNP